MIPDLVVIGAGIVGAACARGAALAGLKVVVLEALFPAAGTTSAGMGHLSLMDDSPAQFDLTRRSLELWRAVSSELPADVEWDPCGVIWVGTDPEELAIIDRKQRLYAASGIPSEVLAPRDLGRLEPELAEDLAGGLLVPGDVVIYPPRATAWFLSEVIAAGGEVRHAARVHEIREAAETTHVYLEDGTQVEAPRVLVAAGVATSSLVPGLPVRPRKGHLVITERYPGFLQHQILELGYLKSAHGGAAVSVAFNAQPRKNGQVLLGSSRQTGISSAAVEGEILARMIRQGKRYLPRLGELVALRSWIGLRPASPDNLPLIGPWSERIWLAAGHEGLGITTCLSTAELLVAAWTGRQAPIPIEPYLPARIGRAA